MVEYIFASTNDAVWDMRIGEALIATIRLVDGDYLWLSFLDLTQHGTSPDLETAKTECQKSVEKSLRELMNPWIPVKLLKSIPSVSRSVKPVVEAREVVPPSL